MTDNQVAQDPDLAGGLTHCFMKAAVAEMRSNQTNSPTGLLRGSILSRPVMIEGQGGKFKSVLRKAYSHVLLEQMRELSTTLFIMCTEERPDYRLITLYF